MDRRIVIQELVEAGRSSAGDRQEEWVTAREVWAEIIPLGGKERFAAQKTFADEAARVRIRYLDGLHPGKHRIRYGGKVWNISGIAEIGRREGLELTVEARLD